MSKRIKALTSQQRDYAKMLKEYFSFHLRGMEVKEEGGQVQAQVIYSDYKHIDTVRRELAQMMPEVEFTKLRRDFSDSAKMWALRNILWEDCPVPVIYVQRGEALVQTTLRDIAISELRQLELEDGDIQYQDYETKHLDNERLEENSWN